VNSGRARYLWVPVLPMLFVTTTTMTAGVELMQRFWAMGGFKGYLNVFLIMSMMAMVVIILFESARKWLGPGAPSTLTTPSPVEAD
jgi:carbon starvation protein